jgi:hypothetical protein
MEGELPIKIKGSSGSQASIMQCFADEALLVRYIAEKFKLLFDFTPLFSQPRPVEPAQPLASTGACHIKYLGTGASPTGACRGLSPFKNIWTNTRGVRSPAASDMIDISCHFRTILAFHSSYSRSNVEIRNILTPSFRQGA